MAGPGNQRALGDPHPSRTEAFGVREWGHAGQRSPSSGGTSFLLIDVGLESLRPGATVCATGCRASGWRRCRWSRRRGGRSGGRTGCGSPSSG